MSVIDQLSAYHAREHINIHFMCNKNGHFAMRFLFVRCLMSSLAYTTLFRPRPKPPFAYVVYIYGETDISVSKFHLGSRGIKHLKQTERRKFQLFNDKLHAYKYI